MTCHRFELNGCFLHVITPQEEEAANGDRLMKLQQYLDYLKTNCLISHSSAWVLTNGWWRARHTHIIMVEYMWNKPVKWGFKRRVLADTSSYTINFNMYTGKEESTDHGLT